MATTYDPTTADPGEVTKVTPAMILIDPNVRREVRKDPSFVSSVRTRGFIQLPVGWMDADGTVHITVGQRRINAALEIGWPEIPVLIKTRAAAQDDERRAGEQRILEQLAENDLRAPLTDGERVAAYKQLSLFGVTEEQIARKTNQPKAHVQTALKVAGSDAAKSAIDARPLTLDQAAIYVEFDGDDAAIAALDEQAADEPEQLDHVASRLRRDRARTQALAERRAQLEADGWTVLEARSSWQIEYPPATHPLHQLTTADAPDTGVQPRVTVETLPADAPGRVAFIWARYDDHVDTEHAIDLTENPAYKLAASYTRTTAGGLTDAEKETRRQKRADKQDMIAATDVRRAWIRDHLLTLPIKHLPADATAWVARALWHGIGTLRPSMGGADTLALELLGITRTYGALRNLDTGIYQGEAETETLLADTPNALRYALALAVAETEDVVGNPKADGFGQDPRAAAYLRQLAAWGYALADVEQRIIATADANHAKYAALEAETTDAVGDEYFDEHASDAYDDEDAES